DFELDDFERRLIDEITLGQGDDAVAKAEQLENFEMLARLRHDGVVGGNDKDGEIDAGRTGEHVLDEAFMPWNIDDAEPVAIEFEGGEADVDGDAARLFFRQTVTVDAGQGLDERRLAMIDMACGSKDKITRHARIPMLVCQAPG